ncbi:MAG TPA: C25 family cysteine peptidase, partial [Luteolibacter sp.]
MIPPQLRPISCLLALACLLSVTAHAAPAKLDFSWRQQTGDFPKDRPGYLILTTEDAVQWSKKLPDFVQQKESMGFHVYVATEKDYGSGKTGNAQAAQVRAWMRVMQQRSGAKYALLIGNSHPSSSNLPSPTIPDGEHTALESSYCDLDGKWVDLYLNTTEKDTRSSWVQMTKGSILIGKAMKEGGPRKDDIITSRISYVGTEIGNGAYDLDRILEKTIRYERETVAGKNLDWRAHALSVISNAGTGAWDMPLLKAAESEGGSFEQYSLSGWVAADLPPQNVLNGQRPDVELMTQSRRRGMVATMAHGWNRGSEGLNSQPGMFANMDDRWPSVVAVSTCTGLALGDNCNMGQTWLRRGAIFVNGIGYSGNNNCRIPLHTRQLTERMSAGEASKNEVVQYGDPSLHVLPPKGTAASALQISPAFLGHYEERTVIPGQPIKPVAQIYTLTNRSKETMMFTLNCDAAWVVFSSSNMELKPGATAQVTAQSTDRLAKMAPGTYVANLRFVLANGQRDERQVAVKLAPVSLAMAYSFDTAVEGNRFPDLTLPKQPDAWHDQKSLWLLKVSKGPHWKPFVKLGEKIPDCNPEPQGKVGGALRLNNPKAPFSSALPGYTRWRGVSSSLWFRLDALPPAKKSATILAAPFALIVDAAGGLTFTQGDMPAALGKITAGEWHFVQFRSEVATGKARASLDGQQEVTTSAKTPHASTLKLGNAICTVDEIKVWSGELAAAAQAAQFAAKDKPFAMPIAEPAPAGGYADDGVLHPPKDIPAMFNLTSPETKMDLSEILAKNQFSCTLRDAPEWLMLTNGILSLKLGTDFDRIDFGGYDMCLVLTAKSGPFAGRVCDHPLKVRIPVPAVNIRIVRAKDNTLSIVNAGDAFNKADRPLAKGVIRYTTDGSPVTLQSPVYSGPFKAPGNSVTARFFYLGEYPYAPVTLNSEFGIPRDKWKPLAVSGNGGTLKQAPTAFDGRTDTAWKHNGGKLPQSFAWDMGESISLSVLAVHSTVRDPSGRIMAYTLYASDDGKTWNKVTSGELENSPNSLKITASCTTR